MKKNNYFITNEAVKYWKKEIKNGHFRVATEGESIYLVNGYNAFVIPNNAYIFAELVQPATLRPAPEEGRAYIWQNGNSREEAAAVTTNIVKRVLNNDAPPVKRTPLVCDSKCKGGAVRVYKLENGDCAGIDTRFDAMVDFSFSHTARMTSDRSPAVITSGDFIAVLLPVHMPELPGLIRSVAGVSE